MTQKRICFGFVQKKRLARIAFYLNYHRTFRSWCWCKEDVLVFWTWSVSDFMWYSEYGNSRILPQFDHMVARIGTPLSHRPTQCQKFVWGRYSPGSSRGASWKINFAWGLRFPILWFSKIVGIVARCVGIERIYHQMRWDCKNTWRGEAGINSAQRSSPFWHRRSVLRPSPSSQRSRPFLTLAH